MRLNLDAPFFKTGLVTSGDYRDGRGGWNGAWSEGFCGAGRKTWCRMKGEEWM